MLGRLQLISRLEKLEQSLIKPLGRLLARYKLFAF